MSALGWLGGSILAWRSLGPYPPRGAQSFFFLGWILVLGLGLVVRRLGTMLSRWNVGVVLVAVALFTPLVAAWYVPGIKQPPQYPIPGRPWLAFSAAPDGTFDLYLMKGGPDNVTPFGETPWVEKWAALSPDRKHIAFSSNRYGSFDLFLMDLDPEGNIAGVRRLTDEPGDVSAIAWSPHSAAIAYEIRSGDPSAIWVIDEGGGREPSLLLDGGGNPAWSQNGRRIAFSAPSLEKVDDLDIWIMNEDGSNPRDVIDATETDWSPRWSPDGRRIAFSGESRGGSNVYIADSDGKGLRNLTHGSDAKDQSYGWSPDGKRILFVSDRSRTGGIFLYFMNLDGTDVRLALRI